MRVIHERVYPVYVKRSPGRISVVIPDLPWSAVEADEHALFAEWERYAQYHAQGSQWELDLAAATLTRRIILPE